MNRNQTFVHPCRYICTYKNIQFNQKCRISNNKKCFKSPIIIKTVFCIMFAWVVFKNHPAEVSLKIRQKWFKTQKKYFNSERTLARALPGIWWNQFPVLIAVILMAKQIEHREEIIVHLGLWHYVLDFIFHILCWMLEDGR